MYGMYGYGYGYGLDPTIILVLIGVALSLWAQGRVNSTFSRYSRVRSMTGMTGAEAARRLLNAQGIYDVTVQQIAGELTDHYDPRTKTVNCPSPYTERLPLRLSVLLPMNAATRCRTMRDMHRYGSEALSFRWQTSDRDFPGR